MEIILRLKCPDCEREFLVVDEDLDDADVTCPHCRSDVPVEDGPARD